MTGKSSAIEIDVFSDYICPFCFVGYLTLKKLREEYGERIRLTWKHYPPYPRAFKPVFSNSYVLSVFERMKRLIEFQRIRAESMDGINRLKMFPRKWE
ncbi:MAG: DsbA family protein [Candidatus Freyrarchaeum guaymaensis]|nr:DsbA family protein [Candidatus Sigynarchaeota archaeon]